MEENTTHDFVELYQSDDGQWRWRRVAANGRILSQASEAYEHRSHAQAMAERCNSELDDFRVE